MSTTIFVAQIFLRPEPKPTYFVSLLFLYAYESALSAYLGWRIVWWKLIIFPLLWAILSRSFCFHTCKDPYKPFLQIAYENVLVLSRWCARILQIFICSTLHHMSKTVPCTNHFTDIIWIENINYKIKTYWKTFGEQETPLTWFPFPRIWSHIRTDLLRDVHCK